MKLTTVLSALAVAGGGVVCDAARAADAPGYRERTVVTERTVAYKTARSGFSRGYTGQLPSCADPEVERRITSNFADTERTYWNSGLQLTAFHRQAELAFAPWGSSFIPRRFCSANTVTTDGRRREVVYSVREWQSWGTLSWGVEWCVTGLDRSMSYAPDCKMAAP